jgi:Flp pilus assembly protein TadD
MSLIEKALMKQKKGLDSQPPEGSMAPDPKGVLSPKEGGRRGRWLLYLCLAVLVLASASWLVVEWLPLLRENLTIERRIQRPQPQKEAKPEEHELPARDAPKDVQLPKGEGLTHERLDPGEPSWSRVSEPPPEGKEAIAGKEMEMQSVGFERPERERPPSSPKKKTPQAPKATPSEAKGEEKPGGPKRDLLLEKAYLNAQAGELAAALNIYGEILRQDPKDVDALLNRGIINTKMRDFASAREDLLRAKELRPHDPAIANALGVLYMEMGELDQAAQWLLNSQDAISTVNLALLYWKKGEEERALALLEDAEGRLGQEPRIPYYRGLLLKELGRNKEARRELEKARSLAARRGEMDLLKEIDRLVLSP